MGHGAGAEKPGKPWQRRTLGTKLVAGGAGGYATKPAMQKCKKKQQKQKKLKNTNGMKIPSGAPCGCALFCWRGLDGWMD